MWTLLVSGHAEMYKQNGIKPHLWIHPGNSAHHCSFSQCHLNAAKRQRTVVCAWKFHLISEHSSWLEENAHNSQGAAWSLTATMKVWCQVCFSEGEVHFSGLYIALRLYCPFQNKSWDIILPFSGVKEQGRKLPHFLGFKEEKKNNYE